MKKVKNQKGFTMAELLIVVAIIAVLVAVAIPTFNTQIEKARQGVDLANLRDAYAAAQLCVVEQAISYKDSSDDDAYVTGIGLFDTGGLLAAVTSGNGKVACWYNPKTAELTGLKKDSPDTLSADLKCGKATKTKLIDTDSLTGLNGVYVYAGQTVDKGIKIEFTVSTAGKITLETGAISFADS